MIVSFLFFPLPSFFFPWFKPFPFFPFVPPLFIYPFLACLPSPDVFGFCLDIFPASAFAFPASALSVFLALSGLFLFLVRRFRALVKCGCLVVSLPRRTQMQSLKSVCWQSPKHFLTAPFLNLLSSCSHACLEPYPFVSLVYPACCFLPSSVGFAVPLRCNKTVYIRLWAPALPCSDRMNVT